MSKEEKIILAKLEEEMNKLRKERGIDSNLHDYDRIRETINENRFSLCHLGEKVVEIARKYPNDADFGKEIRQILYLWKEE